MTQARLEKLYSAMAQSKLDAVAINPGPTFAYLTGVSFHLMERPVVMFFSQGKDPAFILPELETPKLELLPYKTQAFPYGEIPGECRIYTRDVHAACVHLTPQSVRKTAHAVFCGSIN